MTQWHQLDPEEALRRLGVDPLQGLDETEAAERLARWGPNEILEGARKSPWRMVGEQLTSLLVLILIAAAVISVALGDARDAAAILAIVGLNAALGFTQQYRAEKAIQALRQMAVPRVRVRRCGRVREISARELVPGDILLLEAGNLVPADGRLLEVAGLRVQEAALTGESEAVLKEVQPLPESDLPVADRRNMVYKGTLVTYGRGIGVVTETGMRTELGRVARMIQSVHPEPTPLQRRLEQLARVLAGAVVLLIGIVLLLGWARGEDPARMLMTALSMGVAAVPEGLPAVVAIALAAGAQRMLHRRALVRRLPAVETLGSVTVICSDKTGTLTENRMTVSVVDLAGHSLDLSEALRRVGGPGQAEPALRPDEAGPTLPAPDTPQAALALLLVGCALCNDARLEPGGPGGGEIHAIGDPTEGALVVAAARFGFWKEELERTLPRLAEVPFDSERKRMTTLHRLPEGSLFPGAPPLLCARDPRCGIPPGPDGTIVAFTKGAVESLLAVSTSVWTDSRTEPLSDSWRQRILAAHDRLAHQGMRVLGFGFRRLAALPPEEELAGTVEEQLTFVGMVGMIDPPRPGAREAVETCRAAGIRPVMITGDHPLTARQIARELGITADDCLLTGQELARLSDEELRRIVEEVRIFARVSPEDKLRIVRALQKRGQVVAMTGDGVNDAPALKQADIGVAMGASGTDVAREAADLVLLDDNFATIVAAVEEGRRVYDNTRKFLQYILASNTGELCVLLLAPLAGMPLPLTPLQILWINLVTDGLPALALGMEPPEPDVMRRPPASPQESVFGRGLGRSILWVGLLMGLISLAAGHGYWRTGHAHWQTVLFTILCVSQVGYALAARSERESVFRLGFLSNRPLLAAALLTLLLQLGAVYTPFAQELFDTYALTAGELAVTLLLSGAVFGCVELHKWRMRRRGAGRPVAASAPPARAVGR